jgi:hypothetical protein
MLASVLACNGEKIGSGLFKQQKKTTPYKFQFCVKILTKKTPHNFSSVSAEEDEKDSK